MCSTLEARLARLRAAIDEVAVAARAGQPGHTSAEDLAERLAGLWGMIAELDPALAARLRGYGPDAGLCRHPGRGGGKSVPDDLDLEGGGHLAVQAHPDLVRTDRLDRAGHLDPAPVEFGAAGRADRVRDVRGADRTEQPPGVARLGGQPDLEGAKPSRGLLGVVEAADVPGRARPLDQVNLLFRAARPAHGQAAGDQVVAAVTAGHLDHVAGAA